MFCIQCRTEKEGGDFYPKHKSRCKVCCKANAKSYRLANIDRHIAYEQGRSKDRSQQYKAYAATPKGKAARARAHAKYIAKRRELNKQPKASTAAVAGLLTSWGRNEQPVRNITRIPG